MSNDPNSQRQQVLYAAYDLFNLHRSVSCPSCGQFVRDSANEKRISRLRRTIQQLHDDTVPVQFDPMLALVQCATFVDELAALAAHALSEDSGKFIRQTMMRTLQRIERDHEEGRTQPAGG